MTTYRIAAPLLLAAAALAGCSGAGPKPDYDPGLTAADFVTGIDNPFLPYRPGSEWSYEVTGGDETEHIEIEVLYERRNIMGVQATIVRDTVTVGGEVTEDTYDWFAQDRDGNVWYLGEDTCEYEGGECTDRGGSWEWGKDGALPGVVMWARPVANGTAYFQEFYWGEAVDEAKVTALGEKVTVPYGSFTDTVSTLEWNRLDAGHEETAVYARGVGPVLKASVDGDEKEQLVEYRPASA